MAAIPLVVGVFYLPDVWLSPYEKGIASTVVFIVASITDWLDGFLARRWNETSAFGAFLDPVADKLIVAGALIELVNLHRVYAAVAFIIIGREIAISALREWMAQIGASKSIAVSSLGKIKDETKSDSQRTSPSIKREREERVALNSASKRRAGKLDKRDFVDLTDD